MVDRWKGLNLISTQDHCQGFLPLQISDTPRARFETAENLSSDFVEWNCAVVLTSLPQRIKDVFLYKSGELFVNIYFEQHMWATAANIIILWILNCRKYAFSIDRRGISDFSMDKLWTYLGSHLENSTVLGSNIDRLRASLIETCWIIDFSLCQMLILLIKWCG